ncbi:MAG: DNA polymerase III subunit alpha [Spirochaetaceae bacterium]|nr:MAG: DNA polymerase III subunit alpha [Spirochaetaceae bacterium]
MKDFVPLWVFSNYSFLEGASHPEELMEQAAACGYATTGLTDRDGVYGIVRAHVAAREQGIQLLPAAQITLEEGGHLLLYPVSRDGYGNLCALISCGRMRHEKGRSAVSLEELSSHCADILCILVPDPRYPSDSICASLSRIFADRLYTGIARHRRTEDARHERRARKIASAFSLPLIATPAVRYHEVARRVLHDVLTCIRYGCTLDEAGSRLAPNAEFYLPSRTQMHELYGDVPETLSETLRFRERIHFSLDEIRYRYPVEPLSQGQTVDSRLRDLTFAGACLRYPDGTPPEVRMQLERELSIIQELEYGGYFLTMHSIVTYCREQGILCQGRGSAANSAVCYCLGITAIDPVRMNLLFERFLSKERAEPPDIDLDIQHNRREEVIQYMYTRYGRQHAAMVANVVRFRTRSAIREVGKAFGYPAVLLDQMSRIASGRSSSLAECADAVGLRDHQHRVKAFLHCCEAIQRFPRHMSIHPGGFLLGSEPVSRLVPIEPASMPGRTVIQWDKYDVEEMGLFKVDLLGLGALTHLDMCFRLLREHRNTDLTMSRIPADDAEVFRMVSRGDTVGVFQLESRAQIAMLPRMKPRCFYDIVIEISIVRPGPISGGMVHPYLRRRNGEEQVVYPHPSLKPVLEKTLGVPLFQEQVMKLAVVAAAYSPGEADQLRRDMAAWRREGRIEQHRSRMIDRMCARGIDVSFAEQVFDQIRGFGEYGFPESHAASFALIAYSTAWMRHHHPDVFVCALLNAWPMGFYAPATIVADARRAGIEIRPVCIHRSEWFCTLEAHDVRGNNGAGAIRFAVRMGLRFVRGVGPEDWTRVLDARPFSDLDDCMRRTRLSEDVMVSLSESGAFRVLGTGRRTAVWKSYGSRDRTGNAMCFPEYVPGFSELSPYEYTEWDYESSMHSTRGHPMERVRDLLASRRISDSAALMRKPDGARVQYAGLVICRQKPETAGGTIFMTLEDESGFVNLIVRREQQQQHRTLIMTQQFLGVDGILQTHPSSPYILVSALWQPDLSTLHQVSGYPAQRNFM